MSDLKNAATAASDWLADPATWRRPYCEGRIHEDAWKHVSALRGALDVPPPAEVAAMRAVEEAVMRALGVEG